MGLDRAGVAVAVEEVIGLVAQQGRQRPRPVALHPGDAVRDHPAHVGVVVHGVVLVARREEEDLAVSPPERAAAAEHLATGEGRDEDQLVRGRDVERLAVHLLGVDDDRIRYALGDRVGRVDRPDQLPVLLAAPAQRAGGAHQLAEDLRPVPGVQDHETEPGEHVPVDPLDDIVGDLAVRGVAPPNQDVQVVEHLLGQAVLGFVERGGGHPGLVTEVLGDPRGDGVVHAVGIDGGDVRLDLLVPVLPPDENADLVGRTCGHVVPSTWVAGRRSPTKMAWLLHGTAGGAGGNVLLGDDEQDDRRDRGEHGGGHHRAPVGDVRAEVGVDAQRDRRDVPLRGQGQREDEVAPREQEGEQPDGDQRVPADRHHDGQERADQAGPVDPGSLDDRGRHAEHERPHDQDPERDRVGGVGDDQPRDGVEQADVLVQGVEGVRDHDPRDHLRDQDGEQGPTDPAEPELGQGVRTGGGDQQGQHHRADGDQHAGDEILALILNRRHVPGQARVRREEARRQSAPAGLQRDVEHPVDREEHQGQQDDGDGGTESAPGLCGRRVAADE